MPPSNDSPGEPVATIDLAALASNYRLLSKIVEPKRVICVLKADGYGHGAVACGRALEAAGATSFAVSRVSEGVRLRHAGIGGEILVLGGIPLTGLPTAASRCSAHALTLVVQSENALLALRDAAREGGVPLSVHVKLDTGLARLGIDPQRLPGLAAALRGDHFLRITGICTHFAAADLLTTAAVRLTARQVAAFERAASVPGLETIALHAEGSAGALQSLTPRATHVRLGKALYGLVPREPPWPRIAGLSPVLSLATTVLQVREVEKGSTVGYGGHWIAPRTSRLATIAIGFGDGYPRPLSSRGFVVIRGRRAPIAGRVSMDLTVVDVTRIPGVQAGDEVVLIGEQSWGRDSAAVTACDLARAAATTPSRLTCFLSPRVRRTYLPTESSSVHVPGSVVSPVPY